MTPIPRYRPQAGPAILSAGFRPFFLGAALWAAVAVPLWLAIYGGAPVATELPPLAWHMHEMLFGFAAATVAGFLLTAIPNWTGRLPLQGLPLATLVVLWTAGRIALLLPGWLAPLTVAAIDLSFLALFLLVVLREILAGRNWRNLPMVAALLALLLANLMMHLESAGVVALQGAGGRLGLATLLLLIALVGGRIVPSFTRNWLAKQRPDLALPAPFGVIDGAALAATALALVVWVAAPDSAPTPWLALAAALLLGVRLARWRGAATLREPLLAILHLGYGWLPLGLLLLAGTRLLPFLPEAAALHALAVGAVGTMTLAVMTRASLGHTGRPLTAGVGTTAIYGLITLAALLRIGAPLAAARYGLALELAGAAWSSAFGLFVLLYGPLLLAPRRQARPASR